MLRYLDDDIDDERVLVGHTSADDASVYKLTDDLALIQTVDFFTPVVDDPYTFGQIAAANSFSDIYAMGGKPITALNIVGFPIQTLGHEVLGKILQGAKDKAKEAGAHILGGHSVDDQEPKFGLSVTGIAHPKHFYKNSGAKVGDALVLTKAIGGGVLTTAIKQQKINEKDVGSFIQSMTTLNKYAAEALKAFSPRAVTDITGFGLLGHAYEMAKNSNVSFKLYTKKLPLYQKARQFAKQNVFPGGAWTNYEWLKNVVYFPQSLQTYERVLLCDPMTSGGLFISLPIDEAERYVNYLRNTYNENATIIGEVIDEREKALYIDPR